jgi:Mrp family chromosome partitioning ATPase
MGFGAGDGGSAAMESDVFAGKLKSLMARFDYVVFDGDSLLTSSNASMIVKHFDGVVLVVECERTKWEVLRLAREKVQNVGGNVLGVVLNKRRYYIPRGLYGKI